MNILEHILTRNNKIVYPTSVKSKPKQVQNIKSFIKNISIERAIQAICGQEKIIEIENNSRIFELIRLKYNDYEWTYGFPPKYSYQNSRKFEAGYVCVNADIKAGRIQNVKFSGDFIALKDIEELEEQLKDYSLSDLKTFLCNRGNHFMLGIQGRKLALLFEEI